MGAMGAMGLILERMRYHNPVRLFLCMLNFRALAIVQKYIDLSHRIDAFYQRLLLSTWS